MSANIAYYLLEIWCDVEPTLYGPFATEEERDQLALIRRAADPEMENGLYTALVFYGVSVPHLEIDSYSGGFFEEEED